MGELLKRKPMTLAEAEARYQTAIARAQQQFDRAVAEINERPTVTQLSRRTINCLVGSLLHPSYEAPVDPENLATIGATRLLRIPNFGYKCLKEVEVWLAQQGYQLAS